MGGAGKLRERSGWASGGISISECRFHADPAAGCRRLQCLRYGGGIPAAGRVPTRSPSFFRTRYGTKTHCQLRARTIIGRAVCRIQSAGVPMRYPRRRIKKEKGDGKSAHGLLSGIEPSVYQGIRAVPVTDPDGANSRIRPKRSGNVPCRGPLRRCGRRPLPAAPERAEEADDCLRHSG